jgi:hypothetical protein
MTLDLSHDYVSTPLSNNLSMDASSVHDSLMRQALDMERQAVVRLFSKLFP